MLFYYIYILIICYRYVIPALKSSKYKAFGVFFVSFCAKNVRNSAVVVRNSAVIDMLRDIKMKHTMVMINCE